MHKYTKRIRDYINKPKIQHQLLKNDRHWQQLCSCLDVIEDSEEAISAYEGREFATSQGAKYLAVYGLLQALFLQQDAVFNLCESLHIPESLDSYPALKGIREIRHISAGHPTKKDIPRSRPISYHFISRSSMSHDGFDLLSTDANGKVQFQRVSIPDLIAKQRDYLSQILNSITAKFEREEKTHKEKFKMEKLGSLFTDQLHYGIGKLFDGISKQEHARLSIISVRQVRSIVADFKTMLGKRDIEPDTFPSIEDTCDLLEHSLGELEDFFLSFDQGAGPKISTKSARIFARSVRQEIKELEDHARAIDRDYCDD